MHRISITVLVLLTTAGAVGCNFAAADIDSVPDNPTFAATIKPIFDDHCNLCHGAERNRGAPSYFRLDVYSSTDNRLGASAMAEAALEEIMNNAMPPAAAWGDGVGPNAKQAVQLWVEHGSPP